MIITAQFTWHLAFFVVVCHLPNVAFIGCFERGGGNATLQVRSCVWRFRRISLSATVISSSMIFAFFAYALI